MVANYANLQENVVPCAKTFAETVILFGRTTEEFSDSIIEIGSENLTGLYDKFYMFIVKLLEQKLTFEQISTILFIPEKKVRQLAEMIEDAELIKLAQERIEKYGGLDCAIKKAISFEEVMRQNGITQEMIDSAPDIEFEVSAI